MSRDALELEEIAALSVRYRRLGFDVCVDSPVEESGLRADILVRKGGRTLIIEVKNAQSLRSEAERVKALIRYSDAHPPMRFDLVLANPPAKRRRKPKASAATA